MISNDFKPSNILGHCKCTETLMTMQCDVNFVMSDELYIKENVNIRINSKMHCVKSADSVLCLLSGIYRHASFDYSGVNFRR